MNKSRLRAWLRELLLLGLLLGGILAARSSLADHYIVPSGSMEHTLYPGDRVFVDKRYYGLRIPFTRFEILGGVDVERGDVVIFDSPHDGTRLIKRIVATGGDRVVIRRGRLSINGEPLALPNRPDVERFGDTLAVLRLDSGGGPDHAAVLPKGSLLAVGDHRGNSRDGRFFGLIEEGDVYARAVAVYYRRGEGVGWRTL
ncbi:MAG: signal peptidase I [Pseudomonadota bacterium]